MYINVYIRGSGLYRCNHMIRMACKFITDTECYPYIYIDLFLYWMIEIFFFIKVFEYIQMFFFLLFFIAHFSRLNTVVTVMLIILNILY